MPKPADWLDLEALAELEITTDDPEHSIDSALAVASEGDGWRAPTPGEQMIRICFHRPQRLRRIRLVFEEKAMSRTQEFVLRWAAEGGEYREIVRQQFHFHPPEGAEEIEEYEVELEQVRVLELTIVPEMGGCEAHASLKELRVG